MSILKTWRTADGRELYIKYMTTEHIRNALRMLKRKGYIGPKLVSFYLTCPLPSGDVAGDAFQLECDALTRQPISEFVDIFEEELRLRGAL